MTEAETNTQQEEEKPLTVREAIEAAQTDVGLNDEEPTEPVLTETGDAQSVEAPEEDSAPIAFPASLRADERAQLSTLPKEAQRKVAEVLARRESDIVRHLHQKTQELAQKERALQSVDEVLKPYAQEWKLRGLDPAKKIQTYVEMENLLDRDAERAIAWLADEYAVDLRQLVAKKSASSPQVDPRVKNLEQELGQLKQTMTTREQQAQDAENQRLVAAMQGWASAADGKGQPLRPFATDMLPAIAQTADAILESNPGVGVEQALNHAYEQVLWANPQTRQILLQQQTEAAKKQSLEDKQKKVQQAKSRAVSVSGSSVSNGHVPQPKRSVRETIEAAMRGEI